MTSSPVRASRFPRTTSSRRPSDSTIDGRTSRCAAYCEPVDRFQAARIFAVDTGRLYPYTTIWPGPTTRHASSMHELGPLIAALARRRPHRNPLRGRLKRAAVAVILRETRQGAEALLVQRAQRTGDPWSGDMALPGGRIEAVDEASGSGAACREAAEEIGAIIHRGHGIGRLSDQITLDHRRRAPMVVSPFVYRSPLQLRPRLNHEIADVQWLPLAWLDERANRSTLRWSIGHLMLTMPCYECGLDRRLWGLTLRMLDELCAQSHYTPLGPI